MLPLLGPAPYFAQGQTPGSTLPAELITTSHNGAGKFLEAARLHGPGVVFLGTFEDPSSASNVNVNSSSGGEVGALGLAENLPSNANDVSNHPTTAEEVRGDPYFALDVTSLPEVALSNLLLPQEAGNGEVGEGTKREWGDARAAGLALSPTDAAIFSVARSMTDWNGRNKVRCFLLFFLIPPSLLIPLLWLADPRPPSSSELTDNKS